MNKKSAMATIEGISKRWIMKTLLIMRHGKSSWKNKDLDDHERPLKKRGKKNVSSVGEMVVKKELIPQIILCSSAVRAQQTAELFIEATKFSGKVEYLDALYLAEDDKVMQLVAQLPDEVERAMIIGHNPGLESLVQRLDQQVTGLPTAALACFSLETKSWKELTTATEATLVEFWQPADLEIKAEKKKPAKPEQKHGEKKSEEVKKKSEKKKKKK